MKNGARHDERGRLGGQKGAAGSNERACRSGGGGCPGRRLVSALSTLTAAEDQYEALLIPSPLEGEGMSLPRT